jgi:hypothetical protein
MTLRIAVWAAVSSQAQLQNKDSLASQKRDGRLWADQVGGRVTHVLEVAGHSRSYIFFQDAAAAMPAYRELRRACEERAFDVLWCRSRDRLGRTDALIAQVEALVTTSHRPRQLLVPPRPVDRKRHPRLRPLHAIQHQPDKPVPHLSGRSENPVQLCVRRRIAHVICRRHDRHLLPLERSDLLPRS